jgi:hypothetical protein
MRQPNLTIHAELERTAKQGTRSHAPHRRVYIRHYIYSFTLFYASQKYFDAGEKRKDMFHILRSVESDEKLLYADGYPGL